MPQYALLYVLRYASSSVGELFHFLRMVPAREKLSGTSPLRARTLREPFDSELDSATFRDERLRSKALLRLVMSCEEPAAQEFREGGVRRASGEKFRKTRAQGVSHDEFGRRAIGMHRA